MDIFTLHSACYSSSDPVRRVLWLSPISPLTIEIIGRFEGPCGYLVKWLQKRCHQTQLYFSNQTAKFWFTAGESSQDSKFLKFWPIMLSTRFFSCRCWRPSQLPQSEGRGTALTGHQCDQYYLLWTTPPCHPSYALSYFLSYIWLLILNMVKTSNKEVNVQVILMSQPRLQVHKSGCEQKQIHTPAV